MSSIAGRVAIVPQGEYVATRQYDRLDVVTVGNSSYIAKKKPPIGTAVSNTEYWNKIVDANWGQIGGTLANQTDLKNALDSKANSTHSHTKSQITDFSHTHTKSEVTDFAHTHTKSEITDFSHTHTKSEITDFAHTHDDRYYTETEIDSKVNAINTKINQNGLGEQSGGKNIWDEKWHLADRNGTTGKIVVGDKYVMSLNPIYVDASKQYVITSNHNQGDTTRQYVIYEFKADGTFIRYVSLASQTSTYTPSSETSYIYFRTNINNLSGVTSSKDIAIIEGTSGSYEPYFESNKMLTEDANEMASLKFLGWTVPREYTGARNYVDSSGAFHQRVGRVNLGELSWGLLSSSYANIFLCSAISDIKASTRNAFVFGYSYSTTSYSAMPNLSFVVEANKRVSVKNTAYTDATQFRNSLANVYLYYELATEVVIADGKEISVVNDNIAYFYGVSNTSTSASLKEYNYPSGFAFENSTIVSFMWEYAEGIWIQGSSAICGQLRPSKVCIFEDGSEDVRGKNVLIVLMKYK